jgi:hypothetical protein
MITKEVFESSMHKALKARKVCKTDRIKEIEYKWHLIDAHEHNNADEIIEREEELTRDFINQSRVRF